jgi:hypothetical protein
LIGHFLERMRQRAVVAPFHIGPPEIARPCKVTIVSAPAAMAADQPTDDGNKTTATTYDQPASPLSTIR